MRKLLSLKLGYGVPTVQIDVLESVAISQAHLIALLSQEVPEQEIVNQCDLQWISDADYDISNRFSDYWSYFMYTDKKLKSTSEI